MVAVLSFASVACTTKVFAPRLEVSIGSPFGTVPAQTTCPGAVSSHENSAGCRVWMSYFWAFGFAIVIVGGSPSRTS
jgi:hypothetical protein